MKFLGVGQSPAKKGPRSARARIVDSIKGGVLLLGPTDSQLEGFFGVPPERVREVARQIADVTAGCGLRELTTDQRLTVSRLLSTLGLDLGEDVVVALEGCTVVEQATGVTAASLTTGYELEVEIGGLDRGIQVAMGLVDGARRLLQTWQHEAQRRMTRELFLAFINAPTVQERLQIVIDAGKVLDVLEKRLTKLRDTIATNAGEDAVMAAHLEEAQNDLLMLNTMRDIRQKKPVDEELLQRMGAHYAQRVPQAQKPAPKATRQGRTQAGG